MRLIFFFIVGFYCNYGFTQMSFDVTINGSFSPNPIVVGGTSDLTLNFCNLTLSGLTIPTAGVNINVNFGSVYDGNISPTGTIASSFTWFDIGTGWYGISNSPITFPTCGTIIFQVTGLSVGTSPSDWLATIEAPNNDSAPGNNTGSAGLTVNMAPMPVELLSFDGRSDECRKADLKWITASEKNGDFMEIERSHDGRTFEAIYKVKCTNKVTGSQYSYMDTKLHGGKKYLYRIRQVDFDGRSEYFKTISLETDHCSGEDISLSLHPNPAFDKVFVSISGINEKERVKLVFTNAIGEVVMTVPNASPNSPNEIRLDGLASGVYNVRLVGFEETTFKRFIKVD